jgi:hypothetical protein
MFNPRNKETLVRGIIAAAIMALTAEPALAQSPVGTPAQPIPPATPTQTSPPTQPLLGQIVPGQLPQDRSQPDQGRRRQSDPQQPVPGNSAPMPNAETPRPPAR